MDYNKSNKRSYWSEKLRSKRLNANIGGNLLRKGDRVKFAIVTQLSTTLLCKLRRKVIFDFPV